MLFIILAAGVGVGTGTPQHVVIITQFILTMYLCQGRFLCIVPLLPAICQRGDIRLVGGTNHSGRVEICLSEAWGTVCDNMWGATDANVVCRQLGFSRHSKFIVQAVNLVLCFIVMVQATVDTVMTTVDYCPCCPLLQLKSIITTPHNLICITTFC